MIDYAQHYASVRSGMAQACLAAGRSTDSVGLLAVSKAQPAEAVAALADLGQRAFGENYVQEAVDKIRALAHLPLQWHFIGRLQSNKAALVAEHFDVCQSVDRMRLVDALARARRSEQAPLGVLLQVNVDDEPGKGGAHPDELPGLLQAVAARPTLRLRGLMAIPRPAADPRLRRQAFDRLAALFRAAQQDHPGLDLLSMGMSEDYASAIAAGSTLVRIGSALFGPRQRP